MRRVWTALGLFTAWVFAAAHVNATPLADPFLQTQLAGYGVPVFPGTVSSYEAATGRLRISSLLAGAEFFGAPGSPFTSRVEIEAGVDAAGNVIDAGHLRWDGDFGGGFELLASARLKDLGFGEQGVEESVRFFRSLHLLFDLDFLSPIVPGTSRFLGLFLEHSWTSPHASPFVDDWTCLASQEGVRCREAFSTSALAGLNKTVPEPSAVALFALALAALALMRRGPQRQRVHARPDERRRS